MFKNWIIAGALTIALATLALATVPKTVNYQGYLKNADGTPVNATVNVTFSLYSSNPARNNPVWRDTRSITPLSGVYNIVLGQAKPITASFDVPYWLGVQVETDPELAPLQPLAASPYAFRAATADSVGSGALADSSITTTKLAAGAVTDIKIAGPISGSKISGNIPGNAANVSGVVAVTNGGTGSTTAAGARTALAVPGLATANTFTAGTQTMQTGADTNTGLVVKANSATQSANLQEWQNSTGSPVASIGTTGSLVLTGNLILPFSNASAGTIYSGTNRLLHTYGGLGNFFAGINAGNLTMTGPYNTATGNSALYTNTTGDSNTASGALALYNNTTGYRNTASGTMTLYRNTIGSSNTASGYEALYSNTTGYQNTASGTLALYSNTIGVSNTATGNSALGYNTTGNSNTADGESALSANTTGNNNTAIGYRAGITTTYANANTTGSNNTFIGANAGPGVSTQLTNATAIGYSALVNTSNSLALGGTGTNAVKVGIGTAAPSEALDVIGNVRINDKDIYLRVGTDKAHGLGWYGDGKLFSGTNIDGPILYGWSGGALGTTDPELIALSWDYNKNVQVSGDLLAGSNIKLQNHDLLLRGDVNHGLGWYGSSKLFSGTNIDGPVLYGFSGGALGTTNGGQKGALLWYNDQRVWMPGNLSVSGSLSKGSGSFKIDHPLDPQTKYLYHSFVESPDMMNIYNGNVVTDEKGYATVELPAWFEALNREFRYQLTVIDEKDDAAFTQAKVVRGVADNRFTIRTSVPITTVSWQVTGIRKDPYAEAHRIQVEEVKPSTEQGTCLHPEACR